MCKKNSKKNLQKEQKLGFFFNLQISLLLYIYNHIAKYRIFNLSETSKQTIILKGKNYEKN